MVGPTQMRGRVSTEFAKASTAFLLEQTIHSDESKPDENSGI